MCRNIENPQKLKSEKENNIYYVHQNFDDFEHIKEVAINWNLDFNQLDAGRFNGHLSMLNINDLQIISAKFNRHFDQKGITPKGFRTFSIPAEKQQSFKWRNIDVNSNDLMIFPKSREIDAVTMPGFDVFTVSIADEIIELFSKSSEGESFNFLKQEAEIIHLQPQSANILRNQLKYLISGLNQNPDKIHSKAFQKILIDEVPSLLLNNLTNNKRDFKLAEKRVRDISMKKAIDYLKECKADMPTVRELCLIAGASERTLEYAFKDSFGISPKNYIKKQRLNLVHNALKKADPNRIKIKDIAQQFGFWHLGQFGADYKKLFQELPSSTILREYYPEKL